MTEDHFRDEETDGKGMKGKPQSVDAFAEAYRDLINNTMVPVFPKDFDTSAFHSGGFIKPATDADLPVFLSRGEHRIHYPHMDTVKVEQARLRPKIVIVDIDAIDPAIEELVRRSIGERYDTEVLKILSGPPEMSSVLPEFGGRPVPEFETPRWRSPDSNPVADLEKFMADMQDESGQFKPGLGWFDPKVHERLWDRIDATVRRQTMSKRAYRRWRARQRRRNRK